MKRILLFSFLSILGLSATAQDSLDCALDANFTYSISGGNLYLTNTSTGEPDFPFYEWSVDGAYSTFENPVFSTADFEATELVCLTVFDSLEDCTDMICMTLTFDEDSVIVEDSTDCMLIANFTYSISGGNLYLTNTSTGEPDMPYYEWSVDGSYSTFENPVFPTADFEATELVCLTVFDSLEDCTDMICMTLVFDEDSVIVDDSTDCMLIANFTYSISGGMIYFTNTSTGEPFDAFYDWSIGDLSSTEEDPSFPTDGFDDTELACFTVYDSLWECSDSICMTISFIDDSTDIDSTASLFQHEKLDINIYPNPAKEQLNITFENTNGVNQVSVYNALGELVRMEKTGLKPEQLTIDIATLPKGLYIVQIVKEENPAQTMQKKLIKQ